MSKKLNMYVERCKGCKLCENSCPKDALEIKNSINVKGYAYPNLDESKCITCGICYNVCPDYVFEIIEEI